MTKTSRDFQVFAKPAGPLCNLECQYCYYLNRQPLRHDIESSRMPDALLEEYIVQHIEASTGPTIAFSWHGGEPTLLGLDYFRRIVSLQHRHQPRNASIFNGIQTNGILLDDAWCRFLASEGFGVGLSMDGPAELHDCYRVTKGKAPTHAQVLRAFERLRRHGISCDILCAVHDRNVLHPLQVYRFFKEIGAQYLGFLPIVQKMPGAASGPHTAPAELFGEFLCAIFDEWRRRDIGRIAVQIFEEAARPAQGSNHSLCIFRKTCGQIPAIEHNGDFYPCDHFVDGQHRYGNIRETRLSKLLDSPEQKAFGKAKQNTLPRYCRQCDVLDMCNGGCPKDRFIRTPDGEEGLNYLCPGYRRFFAYSRPFFMKVAALARAGQGSVRTGRNDPCPCGSGLKYKKCCFGKEEKNSRAGT
jgi:uncharacterized protein